MDEEILNVVKEKGLLLEKSVYDLLESFHDVKVAKEFLENLEKATGQKIITKSVLSNNVGFVKSVVSKLPGEDKVAVENVFVKLGISLEVRKEKEILSVIDKKGRNREGYSEEFKKIDIGGESEKERSIDLLGKKLGRDYRVFYSETADKKLEVKDFTGNFRSRYQEMQKILMYRNELQNLISIGKLSNDRANVSFIGIVSEKRVTKNKNLIIRFEDLTGEVITIVKNGSEIFGRAEELLLDDIVGVKASGNRDMLFVHDIIFPDASIPERMKFEKEECLAFLSDLHVGSDRHLKKSFGKFLEWLNGDDKTAKKIKYIFFVGDNVDGVGIFPGQESVLEEGLRSMEEQYEVLSSYLMRVPKHITMFMCAGQHDAVRVAEPQPLIERKYAKPLYEIENLVLVTNPTTVKLLERGLGDRSGDKEFNVLMYHGASIHGFINGIKELREIKAHKCPAKAVRHMLKRRHLAPSHSEVVYIPNVEKDSLLIRLVPDVLCTGEVHRVDVDNYNGVLIITGSCWQAMTPFEEKVGNEPDPCKVPVLNLKTRELKVFDFVDEEELKRWKK